MKKRGPYFNQAPVSIAIPATKKEVPSEQFSLLIRHMEAKKSNNEKGAEKIKEEALKAGFTILEPK